MTTTTNIPQLKFNKLTESQYQGTTPVEGEFYLTPEADYALNAEVVHKTGDETINGIKTFDGSNVITNKEFISLTPSPYGQFRAISGNYGFFIRNDGGSTYFLLTDSNDQYGTWNSLRPLSIENATGTVRINNSVVSAFVTETWKSGASWYRVWSDGWIEQGSYSTNKTNTQTITFYKAFTNIPTLQTTIVTTRGAASYDGEIFPRSISNTMFVFGSRLNDCSGWSWYACGY